MHRHTIYRGLLCLVLALALLLCCATALALDKNVNMSVNLDMEDGVYQTLARKTFSLRVQLDKEGLTALRINFGDSMEYVNYWGEDWDNLLATGVLETGAWFSSGDYEMYAQAYYGEAFWEDGSDDDSRFDPLWNEENPNYLDWDNNPQVVKSNVIPVHVTALGQLTQATAKITNAGASVYRGETVNVKVTKYDSNAEDVYGYIFDGDNIVSPYGIRLNSEGMINLPTGTIAPGKYQVRVYSATEGWDYSITKLNLTIKQPAAGSVSFSVNKTNLFCGETLRMSGYAEGAAYFVIFDGRDMHDWEPFWGDGFAEETWPDYAVEDAEYRAYAYDENDVLIGVSDPIYITITSEGDTPLPTIGGPLVIAPGEDVTFTVGVDLPEGMEYSWFDLSVGEDGRDNELFRFTADDGVLNAENEFTITGDHFEREGSYTIYLYVRADNYNGVEARHTILCSVNEERDDLVSMRVLLRGEEVNEVLNSEAFTVEVTAPGAKMVSIVANGELLQCDPVGDGTFVTTYSRWSDTFTIIANATWQDMQEGQDPGELTWYRSAPFVLNVVGFGSVDPYEISVADTVTLGDPLIVYLPEGGIPNAAGVGVRLIENLDTEEEREAYNRYYGSDDGENVTLASISVPTGSLTIGQTYWVQSWAGDRPGYDGYDTPRNLHPVTVLAPEGDDFIFTVSKTEGVNHESVWVTAYAPGAESIELFENGEPWYEDNVQVIAPDQVVGETQFNVNGVFVYGVAHYPDKDVQSETIELTATAEPWPTPFEIYCDDIENGVWTWREGASLTFRFEGLQLPMVEGMDGKNRHWHLNLWPEGEDNILSFNQWDNRDPGNDNYRRLDNGELTVSAEELQPGKVYRISLNGHLEGYEDFGEEISFLVKDENAPSGGTLTLNGNADSVDILANEQVLVALEAENITGWRFYNEDHWEYLEVGEERWYWWNEGDYTFYAQVTYDQLPGEGIHDWSWDHNNEVNWTDFSNIVTAHVTAEGDAQPGSFTIPDSVQRGQTLQVTIGAGVNVDRYEVRVRELDGREFCMFSLDGNGGDAFLPTAHLDPGDYRLWIDTVGEAGYNTTWYDQIISVTEPGEFDHVMLDVGKPIGRDEEGTAHIYGANHENFSLAASYPGTRFFRVFRCGDMYGEPEQWGGEWYVDEMGSMCIDVDFWWGDCPLFVVAYDEDGNEISRSDTIITHGEVYGSLELYVDVFPCLDPAVDNTFTVSGLEGASRWWDVNISFINENGDWEDLGEDMHWHGDWNNVPESFFIPADRLLPGTTYRIHAHAEANGMEDGNWTAEFITAPADQQNEIILTVNGETESLSVLANEHVELLLEAENITGWRFHDGNEWVWVEAGENRGWTWNEGVYTLFAQVTYDELPGEGMYDWSWDHNNGVRWTDISNFVELRVNAEGNAEPGEIAIPDSVERGQSILVNVGAGVNVDHYRVCLRELEGYQHYWYDLGIDGGTVAIPTATMEARQYRVVIEIFGTEGYNTVYHDQIVTVNEPAAMDKVLMSLDRPIQKDEAGDDSVYGGNHETMMVTGYYPGAAFFRTFYGADENGNPQMWGPDWESGEECGYTFGIDLELHSGDDFLFCAAYDGQGNELARSDSVKVCVRADGELYAAVNIMPIVDPTVDITFTVDGMYGANRRLRVDVERQTTWDEWIPVSEDLVWECEHGDWDGIPDTFVIPANTLRVGVDYRINVEMWGYNMVDFYGATSFSTKRPDPARQVTLTVEGQTENIEGLLASVAFNIRVEAPGADGIMFVNPQRNETYNTLENDSWPFRQVDDGVWETENRMDWGSGTFTVSAAATYDNGNTWTALSNSVTFTVNTLGELGEVSLEVPATVTRGDLLPIKVHATKDATVYHLRLKAMDDTEICFMSFDHNGAEAFDAYLPTANALPGDYFVTLDYSAPGYDWRGVGHDRSCQVHIDDAPDGSVILNISHKVAYTDEEVVASVFAPGAEGVQLFVDLEEEGISWHRGWAEDADSLVCSIETDDWQERTYDILLRVQYPGQDWKTVKTATLTRKLRGSLPAFTDYTLQRVYDINKPVTVSFGEVPGTRWYKLMITDALTGDWVVNHDFDQPGTYEVSPSWFEPGQQLSPGKVYLINLSAWCPGYEPSWSDADDDTATFAYVDTRNVLTLPAAIKSVDEGAFRSVKASVVVVPNAQASFSVDDACSGSNIHVVVAPAGSTLEADVRYCLVITPEEFAAATK